MSFDFPHEVIEDPCHLLNGSLKKRENVEGSIAAMFHQSNFHHELKFMKMIRKSPIEIFEFTNRKQKI
jgi:hypothetical protein